MTPSCPTHAQSKKVELLAPAGTPLALEYALAYGADAVYAGLPSFSLRARNNPFTPDMLSTAIEKAHAQHRKLYITANIYPHNQKIDPFLSALDEVVASRPDALIMADPGLILLARERFPDIPLHLSVQANTLNWAAVQFWKRNGISRIILSRELTLDEIESIRQACPEMELEVFVHGALCISYSGRCLLSGYFAQRDANQGTCANSCRWNYRLYQSALPDKGAGDYYLEEMERQGELMPISEDEHGTYILNSRDLCAIRHVERLIAIGVDSLKIEGRTKSHFYVARTTGVYRQAMDLVLSGQPFDEKLESALKGLANRGYTEGFLGGDHPSTMQNYETNRSQTGTERFVGEWVSLSDSGRMEIEVKNRFEAGDHLILITPQGEYPFQVKEIFDGAGHQTDVAPGSGHRVWVDAPVQKWTPCGLLVRVQKKCEIR